MNRALVVLACVALSWPVLLRQVDSETVLFSSSVENDEVVGPARREGQIM